MKWSDLKMMSKLMILASVGIVGLLLVGVMGGLDLRRENHTVKALGSSIKAVTRYGEMRSSLLLARLDVVYMMALEDQGKLRDKSEDFKKQLASISGMIDEAEKSGVDGEEKPLVAAFKEGEAAYAEQAGKLAEMLLAAHAGNDKAALAAAIKFGAEQVAPLYKRPADAIDGLLALNKKQGEGLSDAAEKATIRALILNTILIGASIVLSLLIAGGIARAITRSLYNVFEAMAAIADGDLTRRSTIDSKDEMGMLGKEINVMAEKLAGIIRRLADNSHSVSSAATQMHSTSEQMSTSTEELAAQASTIATACEEMSATSSDIARNCHLAAEDSGRANEAARTGAQVVDNTVSVMSRIAERVRVSAQTVESLGSRSEQIGEIIGTIEDIADQTNLLALNAAIEAARAGEQGRGFAVVADEVRALAERTTNATREISEMIKTIQGETKSAVNAMDEGVRQVEQGTGEAAKSGEALRHILDQIASVTEQVNMIAVAAEQQTATTMEINSNIQQITQVAQITSVSSGEEAATANELAKLADDLQRMVGQFAV